MRAHERERKAAIDAAIEGLRVIRSRRGCKIQKGDVADLDRAVNVLLSTSLTRPMHEGEHCQACGKAYDDVYAVPDEVWAQISPKPAPGGLLCPKCALDRVIPLLRSHVGAIEWLNGAQVDAEGRLVLSRDFIVRCLQALPSAIAPRKKKCAGAWQVCPVRSCRELQKCLKNEAVQS